MVEVERVRWSESERSGRDWVEGSTIEPTGGNEGEDIPGVEF